MERNATQKGIRTEQLLLLLVIALGFWGLNKAMDKSSQSYRYEQYAQYTGYSQLKNLHNNVYAGDKMLLIRGNYEAGTPMHFVLHLDQERDLDYRIDFGNGFEQRLTNSTFTFTYPRSGTYTLRVKRGGRTVYSKRIKINTAQSPNLQLVMN